MNSSTKFVFFDLGNVILKFDHSLVVGQVAELCEISPGTVHALLFEPPHDLENRFERGELDAGQFHDRFCQLAGVAIDRESLLHALSDIFWINGSVLPVVSQLAALRFPMAILSNTCSAHWEHAQNNYGFLGQLFSDAILSYQEKCMKPDAKIYESAIELAKQRVGCSAAEVFFTDDKQENIDAARMAGIDAEIFTDSVNLVNQLVSRGVIAG